MVERIKELGKNKHMSLNDIEKACNIGINTIYRWDKASPATDKLQRVADYFGVTVDYLLGRDGNQAPEYATEEDLEMLHKNPELRVLLSAGAHLSKQDIQFMADLMRKMKGNE